MLNVIKASAGSGKTYTLTLEYISMLLSVDGPDGKQALYNRSKRDFPRERHRHILAVTFTNMATDEMKERIIKELSVLAGLSDDGRSPYLATLRERFAASEPQVRAAAKSALTELLFDYSNFYVSTIDSFFQMVLRAFAAEADVPYEYGVEIEDAYVRSVGIHDFLNDINANSGKHPHVMAWLSQLVRDKLAANEKGWNPFKSKLGSRDGLWPIFKMSEVIGKEFFQSARAEMEEYLADAESGGASRVARFRDIAARLAQRARSDFDDLAGRARGMVESSGLAPYLKKTGTMLSVLEKGFDYLAEKKENYEKFKEYTLDETRKIYKTSVPKKIDTGQLEELHSQVRGLCLLAQYAWERMTFYKGVTGKIYELGLTGYISRYMTAFRKENDTILISDTNSLLSGIISEQDAPFIYERVGARIDNYLIDEFQDTSAMQWANLRPLLSQSLSAGNENLIIGDVKQSIYRFRNSDPSLLHSKVENQFGKFLKPNEDKNRNWRSSPNVIRFNNALFSHLSAEAGVAEVYKNVVQLVNDKKWDSPGYVRVTVTPKRVRSADEAGDGQDAPAPLPVETRVAHLICDMIDRGYRQRDIAILTSANKEGSDMISALLEYNTTSQCRHEIKIVSNESLLLTKSPSVNIIVSHLRYMAVADTLMERDPEKISAYKLLREKIHRLTRQYEILLGQGKAPEAALADCFGSPAGRDEAMRDTRSTLAGDNGSYSLVSVVERIIEQAISPEARAAENPFISAFQDVVIEYCESNPPSLQAFLRWWDRRSGRLSITSPPGTDAVTVSTIHKAKGLEYPCVIIPYADWIIGRAGDTQWIPKEVMIESKAFEGVDPELIPPLTPVPTDAIPADSPIMDTCQEAFGDDVMDCVNKTYVAFTRAINELHVFYTPSGARPRPGKLKGRDLTSYLDNFLQWQGQERDDNELFAPAMTVSADEATGETVYTLGEPSPCRRDSDSDSDSDPELMPPYQVHNRHAQARFKLPEVFRTVQQERGTMLHDVMSRIGYSSDVGRALLFCRTRGIIPADKYQSTCELIAAIVDQSDEVRSWFAPGNQVYNERTIIDGDTRYRPDRIVVTPDGRTIVIDYKFGDPHPQEYAAQVRRYMSLLAAAGFTGLAGRVWYPLLGRVDTVDPAAPPAQTGPASSECKPAPITGAKKMAD